MTKLNIPYLSTIVIDYCWMISIFLTFYLLAADSKNALSAGLAMLYLSFVNTVREQIYWMLHEASFSEFKTKWKLLNHTDYFMDIFTNVSLVVFGTACMTHYGLIDCRFSSGIGGIMHSLMIISRDYYIINLLKDNTAMRYVHPWMHKRENYWLHKRHHEATKNANIWHSYVFDLADFFVEFLIGGLLALAANKLLFGTASIHLLSLMFCVWTDGNCHSENPYSQCIGNPFLDYFFKVNICHNLHHSSETASKYMVIWPYHHVSKKERENDIAKYNQMMKTSVDYRFFIE